MGFKTATEAERDVAIKARSSRGLAYVKGDIEIFTPIDGDNQIRIVPPLSEDDHATLWGLEVWAYYLNNQSFLSSKTLKKADTDPIADHFFKLRQSDPESAKTFRGVKRHLMFILDLNDDKEQLKLWAAPPTLVDEFIRLSKNRRTGQLIPLEDPKDGRIIFFTKTGTGIGTKYTGVEVGREPYPLDEALADELDTFESLLDIRSVVELNQVLSSVQEGGNTPPELQPAPVQNTVTANQPVAAPEPAAPREASVGATSPTAPVTRVVEEPVGDEDIRARVRAKLKAARQQ